MTGFRTITLDGLSVLVNDGPADSAIGTVTGESAAALWTRQVLTDGRLRAVVLNSSCEDFGEVHRIAERVAEVLGVSAVDIAIRPTGCAVLVTDDDRTGALPADDALLLAGGTRSGVPDVRTVHPVAKAVPSP